MNKEIQSVYIVTDYRTGNWTREIIDGDGQKAANKVREGFPRHTKFVLAGFYIGDTFVRLQVKNRFHD